MIRSGITVDIAKAQESTSFQRKTKDKAKIKTTKI